MLYFLIFTPTQEILRLCPPAIKVDDAEEEELAEHPKESESTFIRNEDQIEEMKNDEFDQIANTIEEVTKEESKPVIDNTIGEQQSLLTVEPVPQIRYKQGL